jgi:pre-mRNA-splicing factor 38B
MSRSALSRQAGSVKDRELRADELFQDACAEGRSRSSTIPLWGTDDSFHLHPMLLRNLIQSAYFQKCCENLQNWNAVIDEIYYQVKSLQPFQVSTTPSTAFCLLLRLMTMRMTSHQLDLTLNHADSPYIRGIGFLYVRYCVKPEQVLSLIQPFFHDEQELIVATGGKNGTTQQAMGEFVRTLFSSRDYYGTTLPRYPLLVERNLSVKILQADKVAKRALLHVKNQYNMRIFQTLGSAVMALYEDEENPLQWYPAVIDRVITTSPDDGSRLNLPKFIVTFTEYGNTETVMLGELDILDGSWKQDRFSAVAADDKALYDEVRQRERDRATATKHWAPRPSAALQTLAQQPSRIQKEIFKPAPNHCKQESFDRRREEAAPSTRPVKRSAEQEAAIAAKKRQLMNKYA